MVLVHLIIIFFVFLLFYISLRFLYLYVIKIFLTRIFNADVTFHSGHSFYAIRDVQIISETFHVECQLFKPSFGIHTKMRIKKMRILKGNLPDLINIYMEAQRLIDLALPSKRFFHISLDIDSFEFKTEDFSLTTTNICSVHTDTQHSIVYQNLTFTNSKISAKCDEYTHTIHFCGNTPKSIKILRPIFSIQCEGNVLFSEKIELSGYSNVPSIWRATVLLNNVHITFINLPEQFRIKNETLDIKFSESILISLISSTVSFESLHIRNQSRKFKLKLKEVELSHDKIHVNNVLGHLHVRFLRLFNHVQLFLYASFTISKTELLITMDNGECCDIVILNYEESEKHEESIINEENKDWTVEDEERSIINDDYNYEFFNNFNRFCNSFNYRNTSIKQAESVLDNTSSRYDELKSKPHEKFIKNEVIKADEIKMEMIAHRTLIASVHMSHFKLTNDDKSKITLDTINVIYANSATFQLYCKEVYSGFSKTMKSLDRNFLLTINSLRIDELILIKTLTSQNLEIDIKVKQEVTATENLKWLKSLFSKLIDISTVSDVIRFQFNFHSETLQLTNTIEFSKIHNSGTFALFHNGNKIQTCGVSHIISHSSTIPIEAFVAPTFWYISFEVNILTIQYPNKEAQFGQIKGEATSFTFETAIMCQDVVINKQHDDCVPFTNKLVEDQYNDSPTQIGVSIFDFWVPNVLPLARDEVAINLQASTSSMNDTFDISGSSLLSSFRFKPFNVSSSILVPNNRIKRAATLKLPNMPSQYDYDDVRYRPSQHKEESRLLSQESSEFLKLRVSAQQSYEFKSALANMSSNLTSTFIQDSLFESPQQSILNPNRVIENNSVQAFRLFNDSLVNLHLKEEQQPRKQPIQPKLDTIRCTFEGFNGEYFTNPDGSIEFKLEKAKFEQMMMTNVVATFKKRIPDTFEADQIEWPNMKVFFASYSLQTRRFAAKSIIFNSSFPQEAFYNPKFSFNEAEIGQILYQQINLDSVVISSKQSMINADLKDSKNADNISLLQASIQNRKAGMIHKEAFYATIKCNAISMKSPQCSFRAFDVTSTLDHNKISIDSRKLRITFHTDFNFTSISSYLIPGKTLITANKIKIKFKPPLSPMLRQTDSTHMVSTHELVLEACQVNGQPVRPQMTFDYTDGFTFAMISQKYSFRELGEKIPKIQKLEPDKDQISVINKRNKVRLFYSLNEENSQDPATLKFVLKDERMTHLTLSINSSYLTASKQNINLFKKTFDPIFFTNIHNEILFPKFQYQCARYKVYTIGIIIKNYDPIDIRLPDQKGNTQNVGISWQKPIEEFTASLPDFFYRMFNSIIDDAVDKIKQHMADVERRAEATKKAENVIKRPLDYVNFH